MIKTSKKKHILVYKKATITPFKISCRTKYHLSVGFAVALCDHAVCAQLLLVLAAVRHTVVPHCARARRSDRRSGERPTIARWPRNVRGGCLHLCRFPIAQHRDTSVDRFRIQVPERRVPRSHLSDGRTDHYWHRFGRCNGGHCVRKDEPTDGSGTVARTIVQSQGGGLPARRPIVFGVSGERFTGNACD